MEPSRDDLLLTTLQSLRPAPQPEFAAELDERAAAGFPPRSPRAATPLRRLSAGLRAMAPRQMALTGGATALAAIAAVTVIVAISDSGSGEPRATSGVALNESAAGGVGTSAGTKTSAAGAATEVGESIPVSPSRAPGHSGTGSSESESGGGSASSGSGDSVGLQYSEGAPLQSSEEASATAAPSITGAPAKTGPYASHANHRDVERSAEMVLGAEPTEIGGDAGKVLAVVHQYDGIVLNSSVRGGTGSGGASFDLLIPSARLSDALASFSEIDEVRTRHEATNDITAPTNTVGEGLQDSHARIDALLNELADTETETEREAVEAQLRTERRHAAVLKSSLSSLQRRASLSRVSVRIESVAEGSSGGGSWDIGDAFHDAGQILSIAAGVTIIGLAVLAPIALIALLIWLANRAWLRARRERALG